MVELADVRPGHRVLEPSAGTGRLLQALPTGCDVTADFDRIVMNPPFTNAQDVRHILHARQFLAPGGALVALCANGPRQRAALQHLATQWHDLPAGSFASEGTGVNVAMLVLEAWL